MMRRLMQALVLGALLLTTPAMAADWQRYQNPRYAFGIDIPANFFLLRESDNGDGAIFNSRDGRVVMRAYGGHVVEADFEAEVKAAMKSAKSDGWMLSYQRVTPDWASYSGSRNGQVLYTRAVATCGGSQYVGFELVYPVDQFKAYDAIIQHLIDSLKSLDAAC